MAGVESIQDAFPSAAGSPSGLLSAPTLLTVTALVSALLSTPAEALDDLLLLLGLTGPGVSKTECLKGFSKGDSEVLYRLTLAG